MVLILTFTIFLLFFLIVINFFAVLFRLTGMPIDKARFQVISLLTSTGYTTRESETIAQHPTRRKLASWLMIFSYVSTATFISFIVRIITSSLSDTRSMGESIALMLLFFLGLFLIRRSIFFGKLQNIMESAIMKSKKWHNIFDDRLINIVQRKGYGIYEIYISKTNYLVGKSIIDSKLKDIEIQVLSIDRGDKLINFPSPDFVFQVTDKITVYGNIKSITNTFKEINVKK